MKPAGRRRRAAVRVLAGAALAAAPAAGELPPEWQAWNRPVEPFRIAGNLYYVGAEEIAAYLFVTDEGHILLDGGFPETVPVIRDAIEALGFALADVRYLLNSHAHLDHAGGLAELQRLTGATLAAARGDAELLRAGGTASYPFPPVAPDRLLDDGDSVSLGGTTLTARITAGHTPGCTSWTVRLEDSGRVYDTVILCSVNLLPGIRLIGATAEYPGVAEDYERSFALLESLPCDLFLGAHGSFFLLKSKLAARAARPSSNPFVDPDLYRRHLAVKKQRFEEELARQRALVE